MATSALRTEFASALRRGKSSPPRSFRQWVESELIIPDGPHAGERFRIERQPAIGLWIDQVDSDQWTDMVFTAVTQFGKTLFGYVSPMLYHACELGQSIGFGVPFSDMADNKWQADIRPVMVASPNLRRMLPTRGSGSSGGTVRDSIQLANGAILKILSAGSDDAGKAGFTTPTIAVTEAAKFSAAGAASVESDPLRQVRARQRAYKREKRRSYIEGTLTVEDELPWKLHEESTRSAIVSPCPHCRRFIAPDREHLVGWRDARSEMVAAKVAHWVCPECKKKITELQRAKSLADSVLLHAGQKVDRRGRVTGKPPESSRLWYHAKPWANLLLGPADIASEEWLADRLPEDSAERQDAEKELSQFVWSKIYRPPQIEGSIELSREGIAARRAEFARGMLPEDTELVATGIDLGDRTGWYLTLCCRSDGRLHVVDYGSFDVPSDRAEPQVAIHAALMEQLPYLRAGFQRMNGPPLRAHAVWADAGHRQEAVWRFVRDAIPRQSLRQWIMACRGRGESQMERRKFICAKRKTNAIRQIASDRLWYVEWQKTGLVFETHWDSDRMKLQSQHGLTLPMELPGAISLFQAPEKQHRTFARHVANERLIAEFIPGKGVVKKWHRSGANHLLDCLAEAYCALCRLGYQPPVLRSIQEEEPVIEAKPESAKGKRTTAAAKPSPPKPAPPTPSVDPQRAKVASWFANQ